MCKLRKVILLSVQKVRGLAPDIHIAPLPWFVTSTFAAHIQGKFQEKQIPDTNLSAVDRVLVEALMPFQREGVK